MKRFKLKYSLPTFDQGDEFFLSDNGNLVAGRPDDPVKTVVRGIEVNLVAYSAGVLKKFPNILIDWFEEVEEPKYYWFIHSDGAVNSAVLDEGDAEYIYRKKIGNVFASMPAAYAAEEKLEAIAELRKTSTVDETTARTKSAWTVKWNKGKRRLEAICNSSVFSGEPAHYRKKKESELSAVQNELYWLRYYGVESLLLR